MTADAVKRRRWQTRGLAVLIAVLVVALVALGVALFWLLNRGEAPNPNTPIAGIRSILTLYGPGVGDTPFFDGPMGVAFGKDRRIYVADTGNNRIVVFDRRGGFLFQFGGLGVGKPAPGGVLSWKAGLLNYPTDIAIDEDGNVYVADFRNDQIQVFDADGRFLKVFPDRNKVVGKGASGQDGTGIAVTSLAVDDTHVYATDKYQVVVFDKNGEFVRQFGKPGVAPADLDHPNGVAVGSNSMLYLSDSNHNRVIALGPGGRVMWSVGERLGDVTKGVGGVFEVPRGLVCMDNGAVIVADALASHLVRLTAAGKLDGRFGRRGDDPGEFNFPTDIDSDEGHLAVAEKGNNRVQVVVIEE